MPDIEAAERAARRIKALQAQQVEIEEAIEYQKQFLIDNVNDGETLVGSNNRGWIKVTSYAHKAYNESYGKRARPDLWEKFASEKRTLDSGRAKSLMTEEEYAAFQKVSDKRSVKLEIVD